MKIFGSHSYQSHEVKKHQAAMRAQMYFRVCCICVLLQLVIFTGCAYAFLPEAVFNFLCNYLLSVVANVVGIEPNWGMGGTQSANDVITNIDISQLHADNHTRFILCGILSFYPWYFVPNHFGLFDKTICNYSAPCFIINAGHVP
jgi:hypothetical protein